MTEVTAFYVFAAENLPEMNVEKDSIVEVRPVKDNFFEADFVAVEGTEPVRMRYDRVMNLAGFKPGLSVVRNRVPKASNFDRFGFPAAELARMDE